MKKAKNYYFKKIGNKIISIIIMDIEKNLDEMFEKIFDKMIYIVRKKSQRIFIPDEKFKKLGENVEYIHIYIIPDLFDSRDAFKKTLIDLFKNKIKK